MKKLIPLLGRFFVVLSIIFLLFKLIHHFNEIPHFTWGLRAVVSLFVACTFYIITVAIGAYIWAILLRGGNIFITLRHTYIIIGQSQINKYLPGNIFHYIGRVTLGRISGIPTEAIVLTSNREIKAKKIEMVLKDYLKIWRF